MDTEPGRVTAEQVHEAFQTLGQDWNPVQDDWLTLDQYADGDEWNDCCGLTALVLAGLFEPQRSETARELACTINAASQERRTPEQAPWWAGILGTMAERLGLSANYARGFTVGWDDTDAIDNAEAAGLDPHDAEACQGYRDGRDAADLVLSAYGYRTGRQVQP